MERVLAEQGELRAFRTYQKQPAHRDRPLEEQLHGFMWNRKQKYAVLLVEALDLERVPRPLDRVWRASSARLPRRGKLEPVERALCRRFHGWRRTRAEVDAHVHRIGELPDRSLQECVLAARDVGSVTARGGVPSTV